jgi:hypothetical protein
MLSKLRNQWQYFVLRISADWLDPGAAAQTCKTEFPAAVSARIRLLTIFIQARPRILAVRSILFPLLAAMDAALLLQSLMASAKNKPSSPF